MQTRHKFLFSSAHALRLTAIAVAMVIVALTLQACSLPRVRGRAEKENEQSVCDQFYQSAQLDQMMMDPDNLTLSRYVASVQAATSWNMVTANCPARFSEGTIRSAQAQYTSFLLSSSLGQSSSQRQPAELGDVKSLTVKPEKLASMALAEDRVAFSMQVLAARKVDHASLAVSDSHFANGQKLISLASGIKDPRQKVYDATQLLAYSQTRTDATNGLLVPTTALVEMNCVREELAALQGSSGTAKETCWTGQCSSSLLRLSQFISLHAYHAFVFGYPSYDAALFKS